MELRLADRLATGDFSTRLRRDGRAQLDGFLHVDSAASLRAALLEQRDWNLVLQHGGRHVDVDFAGMMQRSKADRKRLDKIAHEGARDGFGYYFCNVPLYGLAHSGKQPTLPLWAAHRLMNSPAVLNLAREASGAADIGFADSQATKYLAGHFLTRHDDGVEGKERRAAYVLSMSTDWRADNDGLLQFLDEGGDVAEAYVPRFNTLSVFIVPQPHSVSAVAPFVEAPRLSITGWFRAGEDPGV